MTIESDMIPWAVKAAVDRELRKLGDIEDERALSGKEQCRLQYCRAMEEGTEFIVGLLSSSSAQTPSEAQVDAAKVHLEAGFQKYLSTRYFSGVVERGYSQYVELKVWPLGHDHWPTRDEAEKLLLLWIRDQGKVTDSFDGEVELHGNRYGLEGIAAGDDDDYENVELSPSREEDFEEKRFDLEEMRKAVSGPLKCSESPT